MTTWDWTRAEKSFTVYEIMCKILKVSLLFLFQFPEHLEMCILSWATQREYKVAKRMWGLRSYDSLIQYICMSSSAFPLRDSKLLFLIFCRFWGHSMCNCEICCSLSGNLFFVNMIDKDSVCYKLTLDCNVAFKKQIRVKCWLVTCQGSALLSSIRQQCGRCVLISGQWSSG